MGDKLLNAKFDKNINLMKKLHGPFKNIQVAW